MKYSQRDSINIERVLNGFIVTVKGTREEQDDNKNNVFIFERFPTMSKFLLNYFSVGLEEAKLNAKMG